MRRRIITAKPSMNDNGRWSESWGRRWQKQTMPIIAIREWIVANTTCEQEAIRKKPRLEYTLVYSCVLSVQKFKHTNGESPGISELEGATGELRNVMEVHSKIPLHDCCWLRSSPSPDGIARAASSHVEHGDRTPT